MSDLIERLRGWGQPDPEFEHLRTLNAALVKALEQCAAEWKSPPCTVSEGAGFLYQEFVRRAELAQAALTLAKGEKT